MNERFMLRTTRVIVLAAMLTVARQAWSQEAIIALDDASQSAYSDVTTGLSPPVPKVAS